MSDSFTHFGETPSNFLSVYVFSRSTTRSTDVVNMIYTKDIIIAISVIVGIGCGKLCTADPSGRAVHWVGLWLLACYDCGFESLRQQRRETLVSVVCVVWYLSLRGADYSSRGFAQNVVSVCDTESSRWGGLGPLGLSIHEKLLEYFTQKYHSLSAQRLQKNC